MSVKKIFICAAVFLMCGCAMSTGGKYHKIENKISVWDFSKQKGAQVGVILRYNRVDDMDALRKGSYIFIPGKHAPATGARAASPRPSATTPAPKIKKPDMGIDFIWPAKGGIIRKYGYDSAGIFNNGINIKLNIGDDIFASSSGEVIYSDFMPGYGNIILIEHTPDIVTVYSHNSRNLVSLSQKVGKGDLIAYAGATGNVSDPQLHFEIRYKAESYDPLLYLK